MAPFHSLWGRKIIRTWSSSRRTEFSSRGTDGKEWGEGKGPTELHNTNPKKYVGSPVMYTSSTQLGTQQKHHFKVNGPEPR